MTTVSLFDAKNRLSALLDEVEGGGEVLITRRGKPVARLISPVETSRGEAAAEGLRALRRSISERGGLVPWSELKAMRDEGRR